MDRDSVLEGRLRSDHPLRAIQALTDETLAAVERELAAFDSGIGRLSIAPQMLHAAARHAAAGVLLGALRAPADGAHGVQPFVSLVRRLGADKPVWDASTFFKNRDRLLEGDVAARVLATLMARPRVKRLLSADHFSVDGTMIQA